MTESTKAQAATRLLEQIAIRGLRSVVQEREMAHHKSNIGFFAVIGGSLLAAALAPLVGGQVAGPKVAFDASSPITAH